MNYRENPEAQRLKDIEDLPKAAERFLERISFKEDEYEKVCEFVRFIYERNPEDNDDYLKLVREGSRIYKLFPSRSKILKAYRMMVQNSEIENNYDFMHLLINKPVRSSSGVLVVTVFTSPTPTWWEDGKKKTQKFSCEWNCYYCPNEPGQPRSYLLKEPGVLRANQNDFDEVRQFNARIKNLEEIGHPIDKIEIMILGGTWESYPLLYREQFIRNIYYAANIYGNEEREPFSLEKEVAIQSGLLEFKDKFQGLNFNAKVKIIGLTIETRPDTINMQMIAEMRRFQVTRVQIGVQHIDNDILEKINRQCRIEDVYNALYLLKDNGFKTIIHLMPDLPGSSPEKDLEMFDRVLNDHRLQADEWKIYPCETVPWTVIKKWYDDGTYKPYGDENMVDVLCEVKSKVHPWIRLNRVVRDIPTDYIIAGNSNPGLRSLLPKEMKKRGLRCRCIRCREVGFNVPDGEPTMKVREYMGQDGEEYFLSFETVEDETLFAQCCLRLKKDKICMPELEGCALIRKLQTKGTLLPVAKKSFTHHTQHKGYGKKLLMEAEKIAKMKGYKRIAVIAGTGARKYYKKNGYKMLDGKGGYMVKNLEDKKMDTWWFAILFGYLFYKLFF